MNPGRNDIVIKLHIELDRDGIDAKKFIKILDTIEKALYKSDFEDITRFYKGGNSFRESLVRDAVLERLRSYRHKRLRIVDSKSGSIVLFGVVTAVSGFILQKTIGQALEGGYKESKLYDRQKDMFRDIFDGKFSSVKRHLRRVFIEDFDEEVRIETESRDSNVLELRVIQDNENDKRPVPSWDKILDELNRS